MFGTTTLPVPGRGTTRLGPVFESVRVKRSDLTSHRCGRRISPGLQPAPCVASFHAPANGPSRTARYGGQSPPYTLAAVDPSRYRTATRFMRRTRRHANVVRDAGRAGRPIGKYFSGLELRCQTRSMVKASRSLWIATCRDLPHSTAMRGATSNNLTHARPVVHHSAKTYVDGDTTVNGMEGFRSMFKRAHKDTFHKMSPKHLERYAREFKSKRPP